ncbi:MAG: site-2 protease family protein [Acidobacteria bacterium]|nr:site-2 protease family protein [Acidobacteriota bacterium]
MHLPLALLSFNLGAIWPPVVMLGGLIFLHELGHFMVAKRMGMPVEVFSLGFGTRLLGFKWHETDVRLSLLPLGGYVKLAGFNPEEPGAEDPHGFLQQPVWKRQLFYSGGVIMNLLTAFALLWAVGADGARMELKAGAPVVVQQVVDGYPAAAAGLKSGDQVKAVDGLPVAGTADWNAAVERIKGNAGKAIPLQILRDGRPQTIEVTPKLDQGVGRIGLVAGYGEDAFQRRPMSLGDIGRGAAASALTMVDMTKGVFGFLGQLVTFKAHAQDVAGPIGIVRMSAQAAKAGWITFLTMTAFISLQLAILNLLPIPVLDGGHMAMLAWERLRGRDLSLEFKEKLLTGGLLFLAGVMSLVIFLDVMKLRK